MSKTVDMAVTLAGMTMKNPVVVASGTFGFGREYGQFYPIDELGGICVKGLTLHRREGNPPPRIAETPMGILNSVGLQNPGVDGFIAQELPELRKHDLRVIANISGNTPEGYSAAPIITGMGSTCWVFTTITPSGFKSASHRAASIFSKDTIKSASPLSMMGE